MRPPFKTIGILGKPSAPSIADTLSMLCSFLAERHYDIFIDNNSARFVSEQCVKSCPSSDLGKHCDLVIAAGGDGTFLATARAIAPFDIPLIGVNLGRLGFLVDISPNQLAAKLQNMLSGQFREEKRYLLHARIIRDDAVIHAERAVNEVVVHRWVTPSMIEIVTKLDGVYLNSQRSDGLIVATPTGSTAYALSAGGPILHPSLHALVLVPLNPHMLTNRPIVIDDAVEIEISFCQTRQINAQVTCDHVQIPDVLISDKILINKDPKPIRILHPLDHDFFHILRGKLHWSHGYTL